MPSFDTDAARDQWAMDRLANMLTSGIKSANEADWSHQQIGNKNAARAWRNLSIRLELLSDLVASDLVASDLVASDLVASDLFDRIKAGGPEWDAIKAYREARDAEADTTVSDLRAIFGEPVEGRDYDVMPGGEQ